jgi:hypothetical protein
MSDVNRGGNVPRPSKRRSLMIQLAAGAFFLIVLAGVSVWLIRYYVVQPSQTIILPELARPNRGRVAAGATISGKVTDARTHQPIGEFTAQIGYEFQGRQPEFQNDPPQRFGGGHYKITSRMMIGGQVQWGVRIEAHGYLPLLSPSLNAGDSYDFELQPGRDLRGRVLNPDGSPAAGVKLMLALPGEFAEISNGESRTNDTMQSTANAEGKYDFPPQVGKYTIVALGDQGVAQADQDALAKSTDVHLVRWGSIQVRLMVGTHPGAGKDVSASQVSPYSPNAPRIEFYSNAKTDAEGRFHLDRLPPGQTQITQLVLARFGQITQGAVARQQTVMVVAGKTVHVTLGGVGRAVVTHLAFPAGFEKSPVQYEIYGQAIGTPDFTPPPQMPAKVKAASLSARQLWMRIFLLTPAGKEYARTHPQTDSAPRNYQLVCDADGNVRIEDLIPGNYHINVYYNGFGGPGPSQRLLGEADFVMPPIPGGVSDQPLKIPDIVMKKN